MWVLVAAFLRKNWQLLLLASAVVVLGFNLWALYNGRKKAEAQVLELKEQVLEQKQVTATLTGKLEEQNRSLEEMGKRLQGLKVAVDQAQKRATDVRGAVRKLLSENQQAPADAQPALDWAVTRGHQLNKVWEGS